MKKEVYLTFDIEIVTAKFSKNSNYLSALFIAPLLIAKLLKDRNLKATFFVSLSPKMHEYSFEFYEYYLDLLFNSIKGFENIKIAPHIHGRNLPMNFSTKEDRFDKYNDEQQIALLNWAKQYFKKYGIEANTFRSGGYFHTENYYENLSKSNFNRSSLLFRQNKPNIDLVNKEVNISNPYTINSITEYPVTSVKIKSIKRKVEIINLSPEFLTLESVKPYLEKLPYINMVFHSFSLQTPKLIRENHSNLIWENLKYILFERTLNIILNSLNIYPIYKNTILKKELVKYLNYFKENNDIFETKFFEEKN
jgi:hypothetical protein